MYLEYERPLLALATTASFAPTAATATTAVATATATAFLSVPRFNEGRLKLHVPTDPDDETEKKKAREYRRFGDLNTVVRLCPCWVIRFREKAARLVY